MSDGKDERPGMTEIDLVKKLNIEQQVIANNIIDFVDENDVEGSMFTIDELDALSNKIDAMRTKFGLFTWS